MKSESVVVACIAIMGLALVFMTGFFFGMGYERHQAFDRNLKKALQITWTRSSSVDSVAWANWTPMRHTLRGYALPDTSRAFTYSDVSRIADLGERMLRVEAQAKSMTKWRNRVQKNVPNAR